MNVARHKIYYTVLNKALTAQEEAAANLDAVMESGYQAAAEA